MKVLLPYWLILVFLVFVRNLASQEVELDNLTVEEGLPAGTVVGNLKIPEGTQKVWLSGIQDVALSDNTCLIVREGGELWVLNCDPYPDRKLNSGAPQEKNRINTKTLAKIFDSGIESIATHYGHHVFVRNDGSAWGLYHNFYRKEKSGKAHPIKENPAQLFSSGIKKVGLNDKTILALGHDGSLWKIGFQKDLKAGKVSYARPQEVVKSGVKDFSVGLEIYVYLLEDGSLWRWTEETTYALDYGSFKSSTPVKIVSEGVVRCDATYGTLYVKDDQSVWLTGVDPQKLDLRIGHGVRSAKQLLGFSRGEAYLKENDELWFYSTQQLNKKLIHSDVQRVYSRGLFTHCFVTNNGKLHFWVDEGLEILPVDLPGEIENPTRVDNHLFAVKRNQLVTKELLNFERKAAHPILV